MFRDLGVRRVCLDIPVWMSDTLPLAPTTSTLWQVEKNDVDASRDIYVLTTNELTTEIADEA